MLEADPAPTAPALIVKASAMAEIMSLFPTPLMRVRGVLDPELVASFTEGVRATAKLENAKSSLLSHTEMIAPSSKGPFFRISKLIAPAITEFGTVLLGETLTWSIKEMWVNVLESGGHQSMHVHANSFISGILYLTPSHPSASTVFLKGIGGTEFVFSNRNRNARLGPFNSGKWIMPDVTPGDLVLFPSYMLHEVPRNAGEQRITVAFNAIPDRIDSAGYTLRLSK